MSIDDATDPGDAPEPGGRTALLEALEVPRNARLSAGFGLVFAVAVVVLFVVILAGGDPREPAPYYVALAFVVFVTGAMLAATVLTVRRALHLTIHPGTIVRRSATAGVLGGVAWLVAAAGLAVGTPDARVLAGYALPWAPLLSLGGVWAVHTRYKRTSPVRPLAAAGAWLALAGSLVVADLGALELRALVSASLPPGSGIRDLFVAGGAALAGGYTLQALAAGLGDARWWVPALLASFPLAGFAGLLAVGPGSRSIAVFAAGCGLAWIPVAAWLRDVDDETVPAADSPLEAVGSSE